MTHTCTISNCSKEVLAKQLCRSHYKQQYKMNSPICSGPSCQRLGVYRKSGLCETHQYQQRKGIQLTVIKKEGENAGLSDNREVLLAQLEMQVEKVDTGCWIFQGSLDHGGYGQVSAFYSDVRHTKIHRLMYHAYYQNNPKNLQVHHTCAVRNCINPEHLQLVTSQENTAEMLERNNYRKTISNLQTRLERALETSIESLYIQDENGTLISAASVLKDVAAGRALIYAKPVPVEIGEQQ